MPTLTGQPLGLFFSDKNNNNNNINNNNNNNIFGVISSILNLIKTIPKYITTAVLVK